MHAATVSLTLLRRELRGSACAPIPSKIVRSMRIVRSQVSQASYVSVCVRVSSVLIDHAAEHAAQQGACHSAAYMVRGRRDEWVVSEVLTGSLAGGTAAW